MLYLPLSSVTNEEQTKHLQGKKLLKKLFQSKEFAKQAELGL